MTDMHYLVQANYGEWDSENFSQEKLAEFSDLGAKVMSSALPENGFVWSAGTGFYGDERVTSVFRHPDAVLNLSVWRSYDALKQFVYEGDHHTALKNSRRWFKKLNRRVYVLWWVKSGELPTIADAKKKLDLINADGVRPDAFDFNTIYDFQGQLLDVKQ